MYSNYEKPLIDCSIFYYDNEYPKDIGEQVITVLNKYNLFPPERFYAGKLTNNRFVRTTKQSKDVITQAYNEKDVFGIDMASGDSRKVVDFWRVEWNFTFYKNSKLSVEPKVLPWNVLSLYSTHGRMNDHIKYFEFFECIKELIGILNPFYVSIDDVSNKVQLMNGLQEKRFVPDIIQEIYWGNYFGKGHTDIYGEEIIKNIPVNNVVKIGNGFLFSLTDNVLDYNTKECRNARNNVKKHLGI